MKHRTPRPDVWIRAVFERKGETDLAVRLFEADSREHGPAALDLFGIALRCIHIALGGHPNQEDSLVMAEDPVITQGTGGTYHSIVLRPNLEYTSYAELYQEVMDNIALEARRVGGGMCLVCRASSLDGADRVEFSYGPAFGQEHSPLSELALALNMRVSIKPGGKN